ncbi:hypothetical protein A605_09810 [Corynebacterium halotolerans YIM 70093 = DSM 44683]|uniref:DUF2252 domain-containing protein n=2 Tax=Corynebacterium halotolerans TaxID=225326 RepID=M1MZ43_9CORY|nr:hypothetical protein A605_09810 [Corynebacterium halotolerans YIM 70093 = DSM 44683]
MNGMSAEKSTRNEAAELLESVAELGLPQPEVVRVPTHARRRQAFERFARATAAGEVTVPPQLLRGRQRRRHIRDTVTEDHVVRMHLAPWAVREKFRELAADRFTFFRGTALLYYRDLAGSDAGLPVVPTVGDVHPENYGVLPGADGRPVFSINDMDEAWMAPFTWDLHRGAVGFALAGEQLGMKRKKAMKVAGRFIGGYFDGIADCLNEPEAVTRRITTENAPGVIEPFLAKASRSRKKFLAKRIDFDTLTFREDDRVQRRPELIDRLRVAVQDYARTVDHGEDRERPRDFFRIHDAAIRTRSGTASRGLARFWVLVQGWGSAPEEKVILELKMARHSSLDGLSPVDGDGDVGADVILGESTAGRIATAFEAFVADGDPLYGFIEIAGISFVVRERSPQKVNVDVADFDPKGLKKYARLCGRILARQHVRAEQRLSGSESGVPGQILRAGHVHVFHADAEEFVAELLDRIDADFRLFSEDVERGAYEVLSLSELSDKG